LHIELQTAARNQSVLPFFSLQRFVFSGFRTASLGNTAMMDVSYVTSFKKAGAHAHITSMNQYFFAYSSLKKH